MAVQAILAHCYTVREIVVALLMTMLFWRLLLPVRSPTCGRRGDYLKAIFSRGFVHNLQKWALPPNKRGQ